jgi:hypothetical protein
VQILHRARQLTVGLRTWHIIGHPSSYFPATYTHAILSGGHR